MAVADALSRNDNPPTGKARFEPSEALLELCAILTASTEGNVATRDGLLAIDLLADDPLIEELLQGNDNFGS
jgi:hypothetical protein